MGSQLTMTAAAGRSFVVDLFGPGMTTLHKVGAAGLWMTLKAIEDNATARKRLTRAGGSWERGHTSVTISWTGDPRPFFEALFQEAFKIDPNGLIWFPALGVPTAAKEHAVVLQEAVLGSFLQHGKTRRADPSREPRGAVSVVVDGTPIPLSFHRVQRYAHQYGDFSVTSANSLAGWLFPGGAVRHVGLGQESTALKEPPGRALALRFAPVGAVYFEIRQRGGGIRPRHALVLPEISNLERYATVRRHFLTYGVQRLFAAGTAEAGFRVLIELEAAGGLGGLASQSCRVISFGSVPWSKQQRSRVDLFTVRAGIAANLRIFRLCQQLFPTRVVKPKKGEPFWDVPQMPDLIARNLSDGLVWWHEFADFVADVERRDHVFRYERGGLAKMLANKEAFPDGSERTFVTACHEAWRRRMGQLSERARRERTSFRDLVDRDFMRLRTSFSRAKNAATLRETIADFWSRAGSPLPSLQNGWSDILPLLDDKNWRKAKDLALLALASYSPATKDETEALSAEAGDAPERED